MSNYKKYLVILISSFLVFSTFGASIKAAAPVEIMEGIKFIAASSNHSFAIDKNNDLWAWGNNQYGQLGDGTKNNSNIPKIVMRSVSSVSTSFGHTAAIKTDGSLWTWGNGGNGQLGNGTDTGPLILEPTKIMDNAVSVSTGDFHTVAIKIDGSLWAWGDNILGQVGIGTINNNVLLPTKILENVILVSTGWASTYAIRTDNSLWSWGDNSSGQLGDGTTQISSIPKKVMENAISTSAGGRNASAIILNNSLWTWGVNWAGQLGNGTTIDSAIPVKVMENAKYLSTAYTYTQSIMVNGELWTWGYNKYGQLGDGYQINRLAPVKIMNSVAAVFSGGYHTFAIKTDGSLWAWGRNDYGQLGNGTTISSNVPIQITAGISVQPPTGLSAVSTSYNSIKLAWSAVSGAIGYEVYRASALTGPYALVNAVASNGFLDSSLMTGRTYYYKVKAYTLEGTNKIYSADSATVSSQPVLNAPQQLQAVSQSPFSIKTTWSPVQGASGYEIYRSSTLNGPYTFVGTSGLNTYLDSSGLISGRTYYYRVKAFRTIGTIRAYSKESTIAYATTALNAPRWVLSVAEQNLIVKTTWAAVTYAMGYDVYRSATMYGIYALIGTTISTSYRDSGLKQGQMYYYKVKAYRIVNGGKVSSGFSTYGSVLAISDYEYAVFPMAVLRVTQGPYKTYLPLSHITTNAMDFGGTIGSSKDNVFAPFTGIVRWKSEKYGAVWLESKNPVRWADGTIDYMTVLFMHDNDISDLQVGMEIPQYKVFYQEGTQSPDKIDEHLHMECMRGRTINGGYAGYGNIYAYDAFFIKNTTSVNPAGGFSWKSLP
jgi:alpha-tubulin suppressor-like RCC1 family protein/fibronectin type 3 domain-containing protein